MSPRSRLMAKLDAAIASAPNPIEAKCLRAERAGLLARQGQLEAAKAIIDELSAQLAWQPNTPLRAWLALAEGLHAYYSTLGPSAQTGIEQAHELTQGFGALKRLHALAAAWLASVASRRGQHATAQYGHGTRGRLHALRHCAAARARSSMAIGRVSWRSPERLLHGHEPARSAHARRNRGTAL